MRDASKQHDLFLFADNKWRETFKVIPKPPYKFSYKFEDAMGEREPEACARLESGRSVLELRATRMAMEPTVPSPTSQSLAPGFTAV